MSYADWDPYQSYDDYICYSLEWKVTLNRRTVAKQTENNLFLAPSDFWNKELSSKVKNIVTSTRKPYEVKATTILLSVNDRSEQNITKHFEKLHIDWAIVERQLQE